MRQPILLLAVVIFLLPSTQASAISMFDIHRLAPQEGSGSIALAVMQGRQLLLQTKQLGFAKNWGQDGRNVQTDALCVSFFKPPSQPGHTTELGHAMGWPAIWRGKWEETHVSGAVHYVMQGFFERALQQLSERELRLLKLGKWYVQLDTTDFNSQADTPLSAIYDSICPDTGGSCGATAPRGTGASPVPEPTAAAVFLVGLAVCSSALRHRKATS